MEDTIKETAVEGKDYQSLQVAVFVTVSIHGQIRYSFKQMVFLNFVTHNRVCM